jgi:probable HAF family extracellular repeat protein
MKNRESVMCIGFVLAFMVAATAGDAPPLTFKFTTINVPGATATYPLGVNNSRVIVGQYVDKNGASHGYVLQGTKVTTLDDPNGSGTACLGINPNGTMEVVGLYFSGNTTRGFLYRNGNFTDIPGPAGATGSAAQGVNDAGEIVGYYYDASGVPHGFLLKGKTYTTLDVPGALGTFGAALNNQGSVVLYWNDSKLAAKSSLFNGKTYKKIDVPGAAQSLAFGINTAGDVIYEWLDSSGLEHAALLQRGKYYKFNHPKSVQTYGGGINDHHVVVGGFQVRDGGSFQGYRATY